MIGSKWCLCQRVFDCEYLKRNEYCSGEKCRARTKSIDYEMPGHQGGKKMDIDELILQLEIYNQDTEHDHYLLWLACVRKIKQKLDGQANVIEKARTLAHNAHNQTQGNMLPDERELYEAVLDLEKLIA